MTRERTGYLEIVSGSPAETRRIGRKLGKLLHPGDVILLEGRFGAGKTVLVQGITSGLGVKDYVSSPSFTLVNEYRSAPTFGNIPIYHADLYRIHNALEGLQLGLDEYLSGKGIFIAEWPERVEGVWPEENLWIRLQTIGDKSRKLELRATGERYVRLIERLRAEAE